MRATVRRGRWAGLAAGAALMVVGLAACDPAPKVATRRFTPVSPGEIRRIAVLPFAASDQALRAATAPDPGQEPLGESPDVTVRNAVADAMQRYTDWQILSDQVVDEVVSKELGSLRPPTEAEGRAIGKALGIDAVVRGDVLTFRERIGTDLGVSRPAYVDFAVEATRVLDGAVVWQGRYTEEQQALSDNFLNISGFFKTGARWVRARDLAVIGAAQIAYGLHVALFGEKATPTLRRQRDKD
jgi:hypothetical protein